MVIDLMGSPNFSPYDLTSLRYIGGGGAAMPQAVAQRLWSSSGCATWRATASRRPRRPRTATRPDDPKQQCLGIPLHELRSRASSIRTRWRKWRRASRARSSFTGRWCSPATGSSPRRRRRVHRVRGQALLSHRRPRPRGRGRLLLHHRPAQAHDQCVRLQGVAGRSRGPDVPAIRPSRRPASSRRADSYRGETVKAVVVLRASHKGQVQRAGHHRLVPRAHGGVQGAARSCSSSTRCPRAAAAR